MKKKMIWVLLALCMVVGMLPISAFAQEKAVDTWDGTEDTSWYEGNEDASEYHITTAEQLAGFSALTNQASPVTFVKKTIYLDSDVDLNGYTWTAVSQNGNNSTAYSFAGTFDGQGHTIHNLNGNSPTQRLGLFGTVYKATIKNINLDNATIVVGSDSKRLQYGTLVSWAASSSVENCYASGKVDAAVDQLIGGLIGQCSGDTRVIGCGVSVDVVSTYPEGDIGDDAPTVGGVVGQFEDAGENSLISDCYFSGSISVTSNQAACGGILGANFDFNGKPGLSISNCALFTEDITCGNPDNITYITAVDEDATVQHCFWPDGDRAAVVSLIVNWDNWTAEADPGFDQSTCGESVSDFSSPGLIEKLNKNAYSGVTWTQGKDGYPVFSWQDNLISANYSLVNAAVERAGKFDEELYSNYEAVAAAIKAVDRNKSKAEQDIVNGYATAIEDAIAALKYKDADYSKVDEAIAKANALNRDEYKDFTAVDKAVNAVVRNKNITQQAEVDAYAANIEAAVKALEYKEKDNDDNNNTVIKDDTEDNKNDSGKKADNSKTEQKKNTSSVSPKTGSNSEMMLSYAFFIALSCAFTVSAAARRKRSK